MSSDSVDLERQLRERGPVIDVAGMKELYAPLLAMQAREGVSCVRDVAYGSNERHRLDVYTADAFSPHARPLLVFVHGGGFIRGDKRERENLAYAFARAGFTVVLPNYRLGPAHRWPAGAEDVAAVMHWVERHAGDFGSGGAPRILAGESAGAAHVAASMLLQGLRPAQTAMPAAVALLSGVYNVRLEGLARAQFGTATPDPRNEAYFGPDLAAWDGMTTVDLVDAAPFPLWISYAEMDPPQMQVQAGELFARLVSRYAFQPALHVVRGHNHLSQLYAIGTPDTRLFDILLAWMRQQCSLTAPAPIR